jgi:hypothetical protein
MLLGVFCLVSCLKEVLPILYSYLLICFSSDGCTKTFNLILLFSYSHGPDFSFFAYKNRLSFAVSLLISAWIQYALVFASYVDLGI